MAKKTTNTNGKKNGSKKTDKTAQNIGIGVGLTAAAVAAAGAYFLYGSKNAKQNRTMVKSWALKAKGEALEALEKAEKMTKEEYDDLIDRVAAGYAAIKTVTKADIADFKREMKAHWELIERSAMNRAKSSVKKSVKRAVKKAATKKK